MKRHSIILKIFSVVTGILLFAFSLVFVMVKLQFNEVIDKTQYIAYTEKINFILSALDKKAEQLEETRGKKKYKKLFQDSILDSLKEAYYLSSDQKIYPIIIDHQGKILMHPVLSREENLIKLNPDLEKVITLQTGEFDFTPRDGEKKWIIFKYFQKWKWHVSFVVPRDVKYGEAHFLMNSLLLTMIMVLFFILMLLYLIIIRATKPIRELTKASKAMAHGNLTHPINIDRNDEIGTLAQSFTLMQGAIREKIDALTESERRIRKIINKSPVATTVLTPENRFVNFNQKFTELFGYTSRDLQNVTDWFPVAYKDKRLRAWLKKKWIQETTRYQETGEFKPFASPVICKDGVVKNIEFNFETVGDRYIVSFIDCTQQNAARKELLMEKEFSERIINSMPGIFFLYAFEKDQFRLKRWNKDFINRLGYRKSELIDIPVEALTRKKNHPYLLSAISSVIKEGSGYVEIEIVQKDGSTAPFYLQMFRFKEKDLTYLIGTGIDLSRIRAVEQEKQRLQERLARAQKMEAIGTLSGGIAHDFNNILSGIFGHSQLAESNLQNPENARKHIQQVLRGARRAAELVQQILTFSRKTDYQKQPLAIHSLVEEVLKLLRSTIPVTIEIRSHLTTTSSIMADPTQVHQVIMNLCTNAYHAMSDTGGILTVNMQKSVVKNPDIVRDAVIPPRNYIALEITDTGHGMRKKTIARVFDPYFTTKKKGKGTGLGLAMVKAIVEEHNGFIRVQSKVGKGSSFFVYFPESEKTFKDERITKSTKLMEGTESLMIVDDEKEIRLVTQEYFTACGYKVALFSNGADAFDAFKKDPDGFDLIITDMTMPLMTGDELSINVLKIRNNLPIILCTGYNENLTEAMALEIGIKRYLNKPVENRELAVIIRDVLDRKTAASEQNR